MNSSSDNLTLSAPLFLIGPTHVGKSYHGRTLSSYSGYDLVDLDALIEQNAGVDIQTIFDFEGEQGFRDREHTALVSINVDSPKIVATGAGVILREENRTHLKKGLVIYLSASKELLLSRIQKKSARPLFKNNNPQQVLEEMQRVRVPLYEQCADYQVVLDEQKKTPQILAEVGDFINRQTKIPTL